MKKAANFVKIFITLARPPLILLLLLFLGVGLSVGGWDGQLGSALLPILSVSTFIVAAVALNDIADQEVDRVNMANIKNRPMLTLGATERTMKAVAAAGSFLSLVSSVFISFTAVAAILAGLTMALAYSFKFSSKGFFGAMLLPLGYCAVPFTVGFEAAGTHWGLRVVGIVTALYGGFLGRIILKDFRDVVGDSLLGKRTFLVRHGKNRTLATSGAFWCISLSVPWLAGLSLAASVSFEVQAIAVLILIYTLSKTVSARQEANLISSIAILGRGGLLAMIMSYQLGNWALWATISLFTLVTLTMAIHTALRGPLLHSKLEAEMRYYQVVNEKQGWLESAPKAAVTAGRNVEGETPMQNDHGKNVDSAGGNG